MLVTTRREGRTAYVTLDNPPVNAIAQGTRQGLFEALDWIDAEGDIERVILSGAGRAFAAGADAKEFDGPALDPQLPDVLARIEASFIPWIAAVHGPALGGGCELMLACRYRVATPDATIGLPEVTLGILPGSGGTQRLPRLVGLEAALSMIPTGKPITGARAKEIGLVHEISDDPVGFAEVTNPELLSTIVPLCELNPPEENGALLAKTRHSAATKMRGQVAPMAAIDAIEAGLIRPWDEAMKAERAMFLELRKSDQARALRHIFFTERGAKAPAFLKGVAPLNVQTVAVVGGGTMGAGIAYACLNAGLSVALLETDAEGSARARANVEKIIEASEKRGLIDAEQAEARRAKITYSYDYADAAPADLAIEAAFESMEVKKSVFTQLEAAMRDDAVLASNTSYLDVNEIAAVLKDPARLVGLHFFSPAHIMKLLEIVRGAATSDTALATGYALGKRLRKLPVLSGVCDGFIGNRILARYREAADTVMMDGSNPWEIDEAMVEFGYAMGPYEQQDLAGLDIAFANRRRQDESRDPSRRYIPIGDRMVNEGRLGKKAGVGWYRYPGGGGKVVDPLIEDLVREEAHFAEVTRTEYRPEEIRERLLLAMVNEAAAILEEGIAASSADIDLVTVAGYGFPRWRGGLMHYADSVGPAAVLARLEELAKEDALVWAPSPLIVRLAKEGKRFADV